MTAEPDELERRIIDVFTSVGIGGSSEQWTSDRRWTSEIKQRICQLGSEKGFQVCCSGLQLPPRCRGEWLYDLTWLDVKDDHIATVPLVLESEWSLDRGEIEWDFCKLILARADHRVMVFQQRTEPEVLRTFDNLAAEIATFRRGYPGDRYLLLAYDWTSTHGIHSRVIVAP